MNVFKFIFKRQGVVFLILAFVLVGLEGCRGTQKIKPKAASPNSLTKRVLVLPFENRTPMAHWRIGEMMENILNQKFHQENGFTVLPFEQIKKLKELRHLELVQNGIANKAVVRKLWSFKGVQIMVFGEILTVKVQEEVINKRDKNIPGFINLRYTLKAISTFNGHSYYDQLVDQKVLLNPSETLRENQIIAPERLRDLLNQTLTSRWDSFLKETSSIPWTGKVLRVSGEVVYINAGNLTGLQVGEVLEVSHEEKSVRYFQGKIRVRELYGRDQAACILVEGGPFEKDDLVYRKLN